jgi:hypothetical protein
MKNTTKLKHLLQLYTISLDMDEEDQFHLTLFSKHQSGTVTFVDKRYTTVMGKAFSHMMKILKEETKNK